jgi:hypothetical protein
LFGDSNYLCSEATDARRILLRLTMNTKRASVRKLLLAGSTLLILAACDSGTGTGGSSQTGGSSGSGGATGTGGRTGAGGSATGTGGSSQTGGSSGTGGAISTGGDTATGGRTGAGGATSAGGATGAGGATSTGGAISTGGVTSAGGATSTGGATGAGGMASTGGVSATGGTTSTGGTSATGGTTGPCTPIWQDPPANVSAWIDESWSSQLSSNVKSRKDWLLDSVVAHNGQINLCVRWGASTAPSSTFKTQIGPSAERWFNNWFTNLAGYGCFPYSHITVGVTGWAVKAGNESWVSDLDNSTIKVYTGTDSSGEPICPDACSWFTADGNGNRNPQNCPGGAQFFTDYWMWIDDSISGGATSVGGDWGLRIALNTITPMLGKDYLVTEHEMGHGFGFQDYYDWTQDTPAGGSLMIVGSTSSQTPTVGDQWLLRRTWKEVKSLRGW